jgi:PilZ domain
MLQALLCYYLLKFGPSSPPSHQRQRLMPSDGTRHSGRIPKQIAIALIGSDIEGRVFSEQTKTVVLSRHGAGIISAYKLSSEQEVVIRSEESNKEIEGRVVGQIGSDGDTYIYGVAFLDAQINFWGLDFPDLSETEKLASQTLLECSSCHSREMADHSDLASDVMAINETIVRYCQKCGSSTLWKPAASGSAPSGDTLEEPATAGFSSADEKPPAAVSLPERSSVFAGPAWMQAQTAAPTTTLEPVATRASASEMATAEAPASASLATGVATKERENRRKHARTRVNFKACVRRPDLADDIVSCEDMSRGGLRFKSSRKYFEKMLIEVAVPYSPGDQAIFVPAQIAYVQELPEQKMYRCGVMYLRSGR